MVRGSIDYLPTERSRKPWDGVLETLLLSNNKSDQVFRLLQSKILVGTSCQAEVRFSERKDQMSFDKSNKNSPSISAEDAQFSLEALADQVVRYS